MAVPVTDSPISVQTTTDSTLPHPSSSHTSTAPGTGGGVGSTSTSHDATFFDHSNKNAKTIRETLAMQTLEELIFWLKEDGGKIAIHDATNTTKERRKALQERVLRESNIVLFFVGMIHLFLIAFNGDYSLKLSSREHM
jgi:6-phosphofructo-2-kinase